MDFNFEEQIKSKTNNELTEIYINPKEYNLDFVKLAELELTKRNVDLDLSKEAKKETSKLGNTNLAKGKQGSPLYIFICFVLAFMGGVLGIFAGYIYNQSKTTNLEGEKFYVYNEDTRKWGKMIMWVGSIFFLFYLWRKLSLMDAK